MTKINYIAGKMTNIPPETEMSRTVTEEKATPHDDGEHATGDEPHRKIKMKSIPPVTKISYTAR